MNREQYRQYLLSGTVTFPATLPQVAQLELQPLAEQSAANLGVPSGNRLLVATQHPSPRVTMKRSVLLSDVRAVFLPHDPSRIHFDDGLWLLGREIGDALTIHLQSKPRSYGIVYIPEIAPSLLEVSAGMTAGESIQYYPPLAPDRAHNHYDARQAQAGRPFAAHSPMLDPTGGGTAGPSEESYGFSLMGADDYGMCEG